MHKNRLVFKRRKCIRRRYTLKSKNRRLSEYTPVNTEFCRKDGVDYLELLMKANAKKYHDIAHQERWERLRYTTPDVINIMQMIGSGDVAQYIIKELREAQLEEMTRFD